MENKAKDSSFGDAVVDNLKSVSKEQVDAAIAAEMEEDLLFAEKKPEDQNLPMEVESEGQNLPMKVSPEDQVSSTEAKPDESIASAENGSDGDAQLDSPFLSKPSDEIKLSPVDKYFDAAKRKRVKDVLTKNKIPIAIALVLVSAVAALASLGGNDGNIGDTGAPMSDGNAVMASVPGAMGKVQSYSYEGDIGINFKITDELAKVTVTDYQIAQSGVMDKADQQNPKYSSRFVYTVSADADGTKTGSSVDMESVIVGEKEYFKMNELVADGSADAGTANMRDILKKNPGTWYAVAAEDAGKFDTTMGSVLPFSVGMAGAGADDISKIFSDDELFSFSEDLGDEKVGEADAYHYGVKLDSKAAFALAAQMMEVALPKDGSDADAANLLQEIKDNADGDGDLIRVADSLLKDMKFEVWIGKDDKLIYRFKASGSFDREYVLELFAKLKESYGDTYAIEDSAVPDLKLGLYLDYTMSGFGIATVSEPEGAKDFKEAMVNPNATDTSAAPEASTLVTVDTVDTDGDGLGNTDEIFYGTDSQKPDTDGDGYKDGEEVKNGYDPTVAGSARLDFSKL